MTIRQLIYSAVTGITGTNNTYYDHFPDTFNHQQDTGLIWFSSNESNDNSFDLKEFIKTYNVDFVVRSPKLDKCESILAEVKPLIYGLKNSGYIGNVSLVSEDQPVYQNELKCWETFASFDLKN